MWFFKRKRNISKPRQSGPSCPACGSTNTRLILYHGTDQPDYVKVWRGQRSLTYRCLDCTLDFYSEEPQGGIADAFTEGDDIIDDEEALQAAEEELKRQVEEERDRRYR